jgi:hypothetical protein
MLFHFKLKKRFERFLHHALKQLFRVHGLRAAAGAQPVHQLLLECFGIQRPIGNNFCLDG